MINFPTKSQLKQLQSFDKPLCLTMYVPFIEPSAATNPNRIELKNMLAQADAALRNAGMQPKMIKKTLRPAQKLLQNHEFWPIHHQSLALFLHPKFFAYYHIPNHATPRIMAIQKGFNLRPLLRLMQDNQKYYLLALGHKNVRLYQGNHYKFKEALVRNFPTNMKEALNIDEYPNWRETHTIAPASSGKGSEGYHGQYNVAQTDKVMLVQFFRRINKRLQTVLKKDDAPLIIGGVGYLLPLYRQANTYPHLIPEGIRGNLERTSWEDLRKRAWTIVSKQGGQHDIR